MGGSWNDYIIIYSIDNLFVINYPLTMFFKCISNGFCFDDVILRLKATKNNRDSVPEIDLKLTPPQSRTGTGLLPRKEEHNTSEFPGTYKSWSIPSNPIHKPLISHYDPLDDLRGNPIYQLQSAQPKHSGLQICLKASETSHAPTKTWELPCFNTGRGTQHIPKHGKSMEMLDVFQHQKGNLDHL